MTQPSRQYPNQKLPAHDTGKCGGASPQCLSGGRDGLHEPKALPKDMVVSSPRYGENTAFFSSFPLVDGWDMLSAIPSELHENANHPYGAAKAKRKGVPEGSQTRGRPARRPGGRTPNAYACPDEPSTAQIL